MSGSGLRVLCLDGGGTRGLTSLLILREIMNRVVPGKGGQARPCEYFDIIAGSGPNGLCAILFVRFCLTVDEVLSYFYTLSSRLDGVEELRSKGRADDMQESDWTITLNKYTDPGEHLEALRQWIVQLTWKDAIMQNISDLLERFEHRERGEFNYKSPEVLAPVGRSRALVMSSESPGYGENGGVVDNRAYNVPIWHRTYRCRHAKENYTMYAVGLSTVASPGIMKSGVSFPDVLATGRHSVHNPVLLLLEECNKVWPGLPIGSIISIGTGFQDVSRSTWDFESYSLSFSSGQACQDIIEANLKVADNLEQFVLPHNKMLRSAYTRFDIPVLTPFFEYKARDSVSSIVGNWLSTSAQVNRLSKVATTLQETGFPSAAEDQVALSSLASLLMAFASFGYGVEAELLADVIANYILYQNIGGNGGAQSKLLMAISIEKLASIVRNRRSPKLDDYEGFESNLFSEGIFFTSMVAYGPNGVHAEAGQPGMLNQLFDYVGATYYFLDVVKRGDRGEMQGSFFRNLLRQLAPVMGGPISDITPQVINRVEELFKIAALATLCEAATIEVLRGTPRLIQNGPLIRYLYSTVMEHSLKAIDLRILYPIVDFISALIHLEKWSTARDPAILRLLSCASPSNFNNWSLVNLAAERLQMSNSGADDQEVLIACQRLIAENTDALNKEAFEISMLSVDGGYFGLLKLLVDSGKPAGFLASFADRDGNTLLHRAARCGFPAVFRKIFEYHEYDTSAAALNRQNAQGLTPLHLACKYRAHYNVVLLCVLMKANVNQQCLQGLTPMHYCFSDQKWLPAYENELLERIDGHALATTIPLRATRIWGAYHGGNVVDSRACDGRKMIHQLWVRGADPRIQDLEGFTVLHMAAKNGWGVNIDVFFLHGDPKSEEQTNDCLNLRDRDDATILDRARWTGKDGGEHVIIAEMKKRGLDIPAPRPPPGPRSSYSATSNSRPPLAPTGSSFAQDMSGALPSPAVINQKSFSEAAAQQPLPNSQFGSQTPLPQGLQAGKASPQIYANPITSLPVQPTQVIPQKQLGSPYDPRVSPTPSPQPNFPIEQQNPLSETRRISPKPSPQHTQAFQEQRQFNAPPSLGSSQPLQAIQAQQNRRTSLTPSPQPLQAVQAQQRPLPGNRRTSQTPSPQPAQVFQAQQRPSSENRRGSQPSSAPHPQAVQAQQQFTGRENSNMSQPLSQQPPRTFQAQQQFGGRENTNMTPPLSQSPAQTFQAQQQFGGVENMRMSPPPSQQAQQTQTFQTQQLTPSAIQRTSQTPPIQPQQTAQGQRQFSSSGNPPASQVSPPLTAQQQQYQNTQQQYQNPQQQFQNSQQQFQNPQQQFQNPQQQYQNPRQQFQGNQNPQFSQTSGPPSSQQQPYQNHQQLPVGQQQPPGSFQGQQMTQQQWQEFQAQRQMQMSMQQQMPAGTQQQPQRQNMAQVGGLAPPQGSSQGEGQGEEGKRSSKLFKRFRKKE